MSLNLHGRVLDLHECRPDPYGRVLNLHECRPGPYGRVLDLLVWHSNPQQAGPKSSGQHVPLVPTLRWDRGPVLPHGPWARGTSLQLEASSPPAFKQATAVCLVVHRA
jgi:hypothetical protein